MPNFDSIWQTFVNSAGLMILIISVAIIALCAVVTLVAVCCCPVRARRVDANGFAIDEEAFEPNLLQRPYTY